MAHAGGRSQAEERLYKAAAILMINRRWKALYGGFFRKTKLMSVPGLELVGKQHQGTGSIPSRLVDKLLLPGGGVSLSGKEDGRDGRSDTIWRRRKAPYGGF
jgi:hypothetical protein